MSSARKALVASLLAALMVPAAASGGGEEPVSAGTGIVKIRKTPPYFHGNVVAEVPDCQGPRKVRLYQRKRNGDRKRLGTTESAGYEFEGVWQLLIEPKPGTYFAAAPKFETVDSGTGNAVLCGRAKSRDLRLD